MRQITGIPSPRLLVGVEAVLFPVVVQHRVNDIFGHAVDQVVIGTVVGSSGSAKTWSTPIPRDAIRRRLGKEASTPAGGFQTNAVSIAAGS